MYSGLLHSHNGLRWLVLLALLISVFLAFSGWFGKREWKKIDNLSGLLLVLFMDVQFLIGLVLYVFVSPITQSAFTNFGAAMRNSELRFYAIEHILMMVIALALAHIGRAKSKKNTAPWKRHRIAATFYTISFLLILAAIPWDRAMF
ncbi:hypothetical protein OU798_13540 [Prolixibacteraceae bacterium Z1-6]|uniref:Cytochrome B n=1 Tax=Draconibacterium aestuarii TaxID=2998507 RepID=A0A9X3FET9_9BACT|nr:hypothetical protein [Prolixibacteraceae bacterium Z1-6]